MSFLILIIGTFFFGTVSAQTIELGRCPPVSTQQSFDATKYAGIWYEYQRSVPMIFELFGKCVIANYSQATDGSLKVVNSEISTITGQKSVIVGDATADRRECGFNTTGCAKLLVRFPRPIIGSITGRYWILGTDYTSYAVVYSCQDFAFTRASFAWVLTRNRTPVDQAAIDSASAVLASNNIRNIFSRTDQVNCPDP